MEVPTKIRPHPRLRTTWPPIGSLREDRAKLMTAAPGRGGPDGGDAFGSLPSPLAAVDDLRAAARLNLAAVGAVGAVLISGGPLVAIGHVHGFADAVIAGTGLLIALTGIALAIWQTSNVLAPRLTTTADLASSSLARLREKYQAIPGLRLRRGRDGHNGSAEPPRDRDQPRPAARRREGSGRAAEDQD